MDFESLKFVWDLLLGFWNFRKKISWVARPIFCLTVLFFLCYSHALSALEVPKRPDGYVTDKAGLLSSVARARLEGMLRSFEDQTSNQVVVATFPSLEGQSLEDFSMRLAETWKVGQKGKDNGVIFLIFKNDRKMRIEVGYGLEGVLPDAVAGQIISQVVAPLFRKGDYERGVFAGVDSIIKATRGEFQPEGEEDQTSLKLFFLLLLFLFTYGLFQSLSSGITTKGSYYGRRYGRGGFHTGGGGFSSGGGFSGGGGGFGGGGASGKW